MSRPWPQPQLLPIVKCRHTVYSPGRTRVSQRVHGSTLGSALSFQATWCFRLIAQGPMQHPQSCPDLLHSCEKCAKGQETGNAHLTELRDLWMGSPQSVPRSFFQATSLDTLEPGTVVLSMVSHIPCSCRSLSLPKFCLLTPCSMPSPVLAICVDT